jgi:hypothetical protein
MNTLERPDLVGVDARRALALYREARNAEQNYLVSYAVLNYYKIKDAGTLALLAGEHAASRLFARRGCD